MREVEVGEQTTGCFCCGSTLELWFYDPVHGAGGVGCEEDVVAVGVKVFGVYEEAVHVEETGANRRKAGFVRSMRVAILRAYFVREVAIVKYPQYRECLV